MGRVLVADEPVIRSVDPSIKLLVEDQFHGLSGCREIERVALDDREIRVNKDAAVEAGDSALEIERLDQHAHAARRASAGIGKRKARVMQRRSCCLCRFGEHLVVGNQCPVYVGQQETDVALPLRRTCICLKEIVWSAAKTYNRELPMIERAIASALARVSRPGDQLGCHPEGIVWRRVGLYSMFRGSGRHARHLSGINLMIVRPAEEPMKRTWTIIGVADMSQSFKWYQSLLGAHRSTSRPVRARSRNPSFQLFMGPSVARPDRWMVERSAMNSRA